jgi:cysteinyl-tRNA synthetase
MATKYLGPTFDIHGGGLDLKFPHHENELAQSRAAGDGFARYWLHNGLLQMNGEKMSKSLGNVLAVADITQRWRPVEVRYYLGASHYRSLMDFSDEALNDAAAAYRRIENFIEKAGALCDDWTETVPDAFGQALDDDLGTPAALAAVHNAVRSGNAALADDAGETIREVLGQVVGMTRILGICPLDWPTDTSQSHDVIDALVQVALDQRAEARARRDFVAADAIRDRLTAAGVILEDTASGTRWTLKEKT